MKLIAISSLGTAAVIAGLALCASPAAAQRASSPHGTPSKRPPAHTCQGARRLSAIVVSVNRRSPYLLTSVSGGVYFDRNGDGTREQIAWPANGSDVAFLALDLDGNGTIDSGRELLSNCTIPGQPTGFEALRFLTKQTNGGVDRPSVSSDDPLFQRLLLWFDANHNGISESWELRPASEVISDIGLDWMPVSRRDSKGNRFEQRGWIYVRTAPGRNRAESNAAARERLRGIWSATLVSQR